MAIYVYKCNLCNDEFEVRQNFSDNPLTICQKCGGELHKVIFASPVHYKGAGWSIADKRGLTGYKRKPNIKVRMATEKDMDG